MDAILIGTVGWVSGYRYRVERYDGNGGLWLRSLDTGDLIWRLVGDFQSAPRGDGE